jgi:predicted acetyltransferase
MSELRILAPEDFDALARIFSDAYPGLQIVSEDDRQRFRERALKLHLEEPTATFHGLFRAGRLLGIMCLYDFSMNFLQARIPVGGVGQVAVALDHKKEHVAKEMMLYSLRHFRERGTPFVALYPFRPDFYRKMGFGYGSKMNQYRVPPSAIPSTLPKDSTSACVRYLTESDKDALADCYERYAGRTHGMMQKTGRELRRLFGNPQHRILGCERDHQIQGYLVFTWERGDSFITNDIQVVELVYQNHSALLALIAFLRKQADQVRHVIINTQDEHFHHLLLDPRNGTERLIPDVYHETNAQGVGLMYRVVDLTALFDRLAESSLGLLSAGVAPFTLRLTVADTFLPENAGSILLRVQDGHVQVVDRATADVEVTLSIEDLSSLLVGTVDFRTLFHYGLSAISDPFYVDLINRAFDAERKPVCMTSF